MSRVNTKPICLVYDDVVYGTTIANNMSTDEIYHKCYEAVSYVVGASEIYIIDPKSNEHACLEYPFFRGLRPYLVELSEDRFYPDTSIRTQAVNEHITSILENWDLQHADQVFEAHIDIAPCFIDIRGKLTPAESIFKKPALKPAD